MKEIKAIIRPAMLGDVLHALEEIEGLPGVTVSQIAGWGKSQAVNATETVVEGAHRMAKKIKLELVVNDNGVDEIVKTIEKVARTGQLGDGKIFIYDVTETIRIRTGERGPVAI